MLQDVLIFILIIGQVVYGFALLSLLSRVRHIEWQRDIERQVHK